MSIKILIILICLLFFLNLFSINLILNCSEEQKQDYLIPEHTEPEFYSHQFKLMADEINGAK